MNLQKNLKIALAIFFAFSLLSCGASTPLESPSGTHHDQLSYEFHVTHRLSPHSPVPPLSEITEADFSPVDETLIYDVTFSEDFSSVLLDSRFDDEILSGTYDDSWEHIASNIQTHDHVIYFLDNDWVGGTFTRWNDEGTDRAEITIFGSGLPIVGMLRGVLIPVGE